jgi:Uncharacterized conserved protein (DUF2278)
MPLETPYGVIVGPLYNYDLANPDSGQWPHYHVRLLADGMVMDSAVNLKSLTDIQIEFRRRQFNVQDPRFASIVALPDGIHLIGQTPVSGALDYVRHDGITGTNDWTLQSGNNLIGELNTLLNGVERLYIFGATYSTGVGVHDVHMNQGDPNGSSFQKLDGIWQDGGLLFQYGAPQPRLEILQIKFETQSLYTDDHGLPLSFRLPRHVYYYIPRWRWPPGDPLRDNERRTLVENGLFQLVSWASAIPEAPGELPAMMSSELRAQIGRRLGGASHDRVAQIAEYVVRMGQSVREFRR